MKLEGDEEGIAVLKAMHEKDHEYLKMLVGEARSNTDHQTSFKSDEGKKFILRLDPRSGNLVVEPG